MTDHPITKLFPPMSEAAFAELKASIAANGQREPAWTWRGEIIDGAHRRRACCELGIELKTREWDGKGSLAQFVIDLNRHRRHLDKGQLAACAAESLEWFEKEAAAAKSAGQKKGGQTAGRGRPRNSSPEQIPGSNQKDRSGESRERAAAAFGTNGRSVQDAKKVRECAPDLHQKVKAGEMTLPQAVRQVRNEEKRQERAQKAALAPTTAVPAEIRQGDCLELLAQVEPGSVALVFADPPYNIGITYHGDATEDRLPDHAFLGWCGQWIDLCVRALAPDGSFWLLINDEYADILGCELRRCGLHRRSWVKWYETFGVNCANNFNRCSRHLFYCVRDPKRFTFNADAVRRPSDRQTKYDDRRADPAGKILDDVWEIPRLAGTCAERDPDFPTQLPLELLRRVIGCSSNPGDLCLDPFSGSATTGAACLELGRRYIGIERSEEYANLSRLRLKGASK